MKNNMYYNETVKRLIEERDKKMQEYNSEINKEIEKESAKYKFDWFNFLLLLFGVIAPFIIYKINIMIFPDDSIWSWNYWINYINK